MTIDLREFDDEIILHFGGKGSSIDAETLTRSIDAITSLVEEISAHLGGASKIEITVEALEPGCFKVLMKIVKSPYSVAVFSALISWVIATSGAPEKSQVQINNNTYNYHIKVSGNPYHLIADKELALCLDKIETSLTVAMCLDDLFKTLKADPNISEFGIANPKTDRQPKPLIQRRDFGLAARLQRRAATERAPSNRIPASNSEQTYTESKQHLTVTRAIFERGRRKWEFVNQAGDKISAAIRSDEFYDKLENGDYNIGPGTKMHVILVTHKIRENNTNRWKIVSYEVFEVLKVISGEKPETSNDPPTQKD